MDVKAPSGTDKAQETQSLHVQGLPERKNKFQNKVHARFEGACQHFSGRPESLSALICSFCPSAETLYFCRKAIFLQKSFFLQGESSLESNMVLHFKVK